MKRTGMRIFLLAVLLCIAETPAAAHDIAVKNDDGKTIYYNFIKDNTELEVSYQGSSSSSSYYEYTGNVIVPQTVNYNGKTYPVTSIGESAFYWCTNLTSVTIPKSVTKIGENAFYECSSLTSIEIPNSVTSIGESAFNNCSDLTSIEIPNSVTSIDKDVFENCGSLTSIEIPNSVISIGESAFHWCTNLTSVTIPKSVTSIVHSAFEGCTSLTNIIVDSGNSVYDSREGCNAIIETESNTLFWGCQNTIIPSSVTSIGEGAFYECSSLTSLEIPNSVTSIGKFAFYECSSLTSLEIPNSVTSIGKFAFYECSSLTSLEIPNSVTSIGEHTFYECSSLTSIEIPNSVTDIGKFAFYECSSLTSIEIPNSVTSIAGSAFSGCSSLTSIEIPNSVTSIAGSAFSGCSSLTSIIVDSGNGVYDSREGCNAIIETESNTLIWGCQNTIIPSNVTSIGEYAFSGCSNLTSIEIPNSVTHIGSSAFSYCSSLTSIVIPNSVTGIVGAVFQNCSSLTSIVIPNSVTDITIFAFWGCNSLTNIIVDSGNSVYDSREGCNAIIKTQSNTLFIGCQNTVIPSSVTSIGAYAFFGCSNLTSIEIPNSVTSIGDLAFNWCTGLTAITIPGSVTIIGKSAFNNCNLNSVTSFIAEPFKISWWDVFFGNNSPTLYVPAFALETYKQTEGWRDFTNILPISSTISTIALQVKNEANEELSEGVSITWYDKAKSQIGTGSTIGGISDGDTVYYSVTLNERLGRLYREVHYQQAVNDGNPVVCQLVPIETVQLHGQVLAMGTEVAHADVSITQWLNGRYVQTMQTKTDGDGQFTVEAKNDSTEIVVQFEGYTDYQLTQRSIGSGDVGTLYLEPVKGKVIAVSLSYQESAAEGTEPIVQDWYSDTRNVAYTLYNNTKGKDLTDFSMQQGNIVLSAGTDIGDRISVTAHSLNGKFADVSAEATIAANDTAEVSLRLIAYGGVDVSYSQKRDERLLAMLYDADGKLVARSTFTGYNTSFSQLSAGRYTLVTMGSGSGVNSVATLDDLALMGLAEGTDYAVNNLTVSDGVLTNVYVESVPEMDASKFELTSANTSYLPNKTQTTAGQLMTMTVRLGFLPQYTGQISNVQLVVTIPEGCVFIDNSVCVGTTIKSYTLNGNRLTIPLNEDETDSRVHFCLIPTQSGTFSSTALAVYDYQGERTQTIGTALFEATGEAIYVPLATREKTITVSGVSASKSEVDIYDGGHLIGTTIAKADGTWNVECELHNAYNLTTHEIYAQYRSTYQQIVVKTATQECLYDRVVVAKSVTMTFYNGWLKKIVDVTFDFENGTISNNSYQFYTSTDFTFVADLTANNNTSVNGVTFYVHTTQKEVRQLKGFFDEKLSRWVAVSKFDSNNLPVNVSMDVEANINAVEPLADTQQSYDILEEVQHYAATDIEENKEIDRLDAEIAAELDKDNVDATPVKALISQYAGFDFDSDDMEAIAPEEFEERMLLMEENISLLLKDIDDFLGEDLEDYDKYYTSEDTLSDGRKLTKQVASCEGLTVKELTDKGYQQIPSTDGVLLYYSSEDFCEYVDFKSDIRYRFTYSETGMARSIKKAAVPSNWDAIWNGIQRAYQNALADRDNLNRILNQANDIRRRNLDRIDFEERECRSLLNMVENDLRREFNFTQFRNRQTLLRQLNHIERRRARLMRVPNRISRSYNVINQLNQVIEIYQRLTVNYHRIRNFSIGECIRKKNPTACELLEKQLTNVTQSYRNYAVWRISMYATQLITNVWFGRVPAVNILLGILQDAAVNIRDNQFDNDVTIKLNQLYQQNEYAEKRCSKKEDDEEENPEEEKAIPKDLAPEPTTKDVTPIHDPSGYVYEAVTSNRLPGVTATIYEQEADTTPWDAEDYSQVNPQVTDETGLYRWDVPMGNWQVRFVKEGYETVQTEWLPVPPPQLEINIPMSQGVAPKVTKAYGTESGITMTFSKYMRPATIEENDWVTAQIETPSPLRTGDNAANAGDAVTGSLDMVDLEEDPYTSQSYASKVMLVPEKPLKAGDVVLLTVKKDVESYCGVTMVADQTLHVVIEPDMGIQVDSLIVVDYGSTHTLDVTVSPASATAGKVLQVMTTSPLIASVDHQEVTLDAEGHGQIVVGGELPGSASVQIVLPEADLQASTEVYVVRGETVAHKPKASKPTESTVERGFQLKLTTSTAGATIYYTLDGSDPTESTTRKTYNAPIVLRDDVTVKAVATRDGLKDSPVGEFVYTVISNEVVIDEMATTVPESVDDADVRVKRTMDGGVWSTLVLPFDMSDTQVKTVFGSDVQIAQFTGWRTTERDGNGQPTAIEVNFSRTSSITANVPVIIKATRSISEFAVDYVNVNAETLPAVNVGNEVSGTAGSFTGSYVPMTLPKGSLFLYDNKFYYSVGKTQMKGLRAFFNFQEVLSEMAIAESRVKIVIDGSDATGINDVTADSDGNYYNLQGLRVKKPQGKGVYIERSEGKNGKKVINK